MTITQATPADLGGIMALEEACYGEYTRESEAVYRERISVFPEGFLLLRDSVKSDMSNLTITGAICSELWRTDGGAIPDEIFSLGHSIREQHRADGDALYISSLAVDPRGQGRGAGRLLVSELLRRVKETFPSATRSVLLVNEVWHPARRLYAKTGYTEIRRLPRFFTNADGGMTDGIVMSMALDAVPGLP
jgi:ribosomal-protein-alanine N-acetyltransferase